MNNINFKFLENVEEGLQSYILKLILNGTILNFLKIICLSLSYSSPAMSHFFPSITVNSESQQIFLLFRVQTL